MTHWKQQVTFEQIETMLLDYVAFRRDGDPQALVRTAAKWRVSRAYVRGLVHGYVGHRGTLWYVKHRALIAEAEAVPLRKR